jgi:hypothetical protein
MKYIHYLYIGAFTFLIACSSEESTLYTDTKNDVDSGIVELSAGIADGSQRAATRDEDASRHNTHALLTTNTQLALYVSGTWTGHDPSSIIKKTTATAGAENSVGSKHNAVTCSPVIYWEDYGTSDLANESTGRAEGLTIFGAAVDNKSLSDAGLNGLLDDNADWAALSWTLPADQTTSGNKPADKDLLISNNVKGDPNTPYDGRYRFANRNVGKLLEFKHALSKITVNLLAGDGFTEGHFDLDPVVQITSNAGDPTTSWANTTGTVNINNGIVSSSATPSVITMWKAATPTSGYNVTKEALVMPHSVFGGNTGTGLAPVYPIILRINADNNIYYVTSEMIRKAINGTTYTNSEGFETEAGKNYIINVKVNQTDVSVKVTATVANWTDVSATQVAPVINVSGDLGGTASGWTADNTFSFYRSEYLNSGYSSGVSKVNGYYPGESVLSYTHSSTSWSMSPSLYWPNHNTHYQFRAVWPQTVTIEGAGVLSSPRVEDGSGATASCQVIKVKNVAYSAGSFPSDLMIARPDISESAQCTNSEPGHIRTYLYSGGICATEGTINLNFGYMMSQVEVNLSTSISTDPDYSARVDLTNAKVEIVNVYKTGDVKIGDRGVIPTGSTDSYTQDPVAGDGNQNKRWSAIVPQTLTYDSPLASGNVKFRITIYKDGDTTKIDDIYYADIEPILNSAGTAKVAPNGAWESGYHYVYNLRLTKTGVKVTATLTDWTTVNADQTIWF